ncbi:MAG: acetyltransferase [Clostridia bacterium]|nr:acetyltransferase [Clostridia bacterium]
MSEQVIVIGGGGHAKVVIDCIQSAGDTVIGILDDSLDMCSTVLGIPILGRTADYVKYPDKKFIIGIGSNAVRQKFAESMCVTWYTAIHPRAVISQYAQIGPGSVVLANAVINAGASVGKHCIVNTGAIIEHDNRIGDYVHISPAAALGGTVCVGNETHIGIGAVVRNNIVICGSCVIGAGAVVVKDIMESGTYVGVPAHKK